LIKLDKNQGKKKRGYHFMKEKNITTIKLPLLFAVIENSLKNKKNKN